MRPNQRTLTGALNQGSYAGVVKTDRISIPRDHAIQRILLDIRGTFDITAGVSVLVEDNSVRLMQEVRVELTGDQGSKNAVVMSGVDLFIKNYFDYARASERSVFTAIANGNLFATQLTIDFRLAKNHPDDYSVSIPSYALSSMDLVVIWDTPANGYGTNTSNWSLVMKVTLFEGIPESSDEKTAILKNPLLTMLARQFNSSGATGEDIRDTDIPVGNLIRRLIIIYRTSGVLRNDIDLDYYILGTATETFINKMDFETSQLQDLQDYKLPLFDGLRTYKGATIIDFARAPVDEKGVVIGLNTRGMKSGDLKFTVSRTVASGILRYIQEQVEG